MDEHDLKQYQININGNEFAVASQNKAEAAKKAGKFEEEITPVTIKTRHR